MLSEQYKLNTITIIFLFKRVKIRSLKIRIYDKNSYFNRKTDVEKIKIA